MRVPELAVHPVVHLVEDHTVPEAEAANVAGQDHPSKWKEAPQADTEELHPTVAADSKQEVKIAARLEPA